MAAHFRLSIGNRGYKQHCPRNLWITLCTACCSLPLPFEESSLSGVCLKNGQQHNHLIYKEISFVKCRKRVTFQNPKGAVPSDKELAALCTTSFAKVMGYCSAPRATEPSRDAGRHPERSSDRLRNAPRGRSADTPASPRAQALAGAACWPPAARSVLASGCGLAR